MFLLDRFSYERVERKGRAVGLTEKLMQKAKSAAITGARSGFSRLREPKIMRSTVGQETLKPDDDEMWETPNLKKATKKLNEVHKVVQKIQGGSKNTPAHWHYNPRQRELTADCGDTAAVVAATIHEGIAELAAALERVANREARKIDPDLEMFVGMESVRFAARSMTKLIITLREV